MLRRKVVRIEAVYLSYLSKELCPASIVTDVSAAAQERTRPRLVLAYQHCQTGPAATALGERTKAFGAPPPASGIETFQQTSVRAQYFLGSSRLVYASVPPLFPRYLGGPVSDVELGRLRETGHSSLEHR